MDFVALFLWYCAWPCSLYDFPFLYIFLPLLLLLPYVWKNPRKKPQKHPQRLKNRSKPREVPPYTPPLFVTPLLFYVSLLDSFLSSKASFMFLSSVSIPLHRCPPTIQRSHAQFIKSRRISHCCLSFCCLLSGLYLFLPSNTVYALPGSKHVLVQESSLDLFRQQALQETVISNTVSSVTTVATPSLDYEPVPDNELRSTPYLFVTETNSVPYLMDTAANLLKYVRSHVDGPSSR